MGRLENKVAVVTGAASGIGRATAFALAAAGARVVAADLNETGAVKVAEVITREGGSASGIGADVGVEADVVAMIDAAVSRFGGLDILHNNAAASDPETILRDTDITTLDVDVWDRTLAVNLRGPMLGCKHAIPRMLERGSGAIVNTSSTSGLSGDLARAAYGASKAGLNALTWYVATSYGKRGIRCNAVAPGPVATPAFEANVTPEQRASYLSHVPSRDLGRPEDIANVVVFLASDESAYVNGHVLAADGGMTRHLPNYADALATAEREIG